MTQDAYKVDQLQLEPGASGTRLIRSEPGTGKLKFYDPDALSGSTLSQIAGIAVDRFFLVGPSGVGASYTSVKAALDAARALRLANPPVTGTFLIFVLPGDYSESESLVIDFDNVFIQGFGGSVALSVDDHVFKIKAYNLGAATLWPQRVSLSGIRIINASATGKACVHVEGGDVGAVSSKVGLYGIDLDRIEWETSVSGAALLAESANHIRMTGGSMKGCAGGGSQIVVDTCASFTAEGVLDGASFQLDFDTAHDIPEDGASSVYRLKSGTLSFLSSTLTNRGALELQGCDGTFNLVFAGTRKAHALGCRLGIVTLTGPSAQMALSGTSYTSLSAGAGTAVSEPLQMGFDVVLPATETSVDVAIPRQPDTNYTVAISMKDFIPTTWKATAKTVGQFTVVFSDADAVNARHFDWTVARIVKNL